MSEGSEHRPVVLVVDDTPDNLGVLFDLLGRAGFEVLIAEDGESALRRVALARPDLILLDVVMPDMDGFVTCERLKQDPVSGDIPVIFMTALTDTIDKVRGFEVGAVDYVTKPFQLEELLARLRTHLTIQNLRVKLQESEDRLSRIFESAMDAIVAVDASGRITLFNAAAERVFRLSASEAAGTAFARLVSDRFRALLGNYMSDGDGARRPRCGCPRASPPFAQTARSSRSKRRCPGPRWPPRRCSPSSCATSTSAAAPRPSASVWNT